MKEWLIRRNLGKTDRILSTSQVMAEEAGNYTKKRIGITPFGIDPEQFRAYPVKSLFREGSIVIGTVKALEKVYGIEILIDAFSKLRTSHPELPLKLLIAGSGSQETSLKLKSHDLGLDDDVVFTGRIPHDRLSGYLNMMDIFVALSLRESFGVAVIEASACELPVVVTNIGGLKEVVEDNVTGLLVPPENAEETVVALEKLIFNPELRKELGRNGRNRVKKLYDWNKNVSTMIAIYQQSLGA
jgi:glycosyltransferase involved in cell wall biosynthesis